ncbi:MAG TPA: cytochrome P450 [Candidatus Binataceae bacterium]|nr:cytochrome P450 [Candidatus Binataceae bacterium]
MSELATNEIYFNQWDPEFRANPYPYYKAMLQGPPRIINITIPATPDLLKTLGIEDPAIKEIPLPTALAARYQDCATILRDHQHFSSARPVSAASREQRDQGPFKGATTMLFSDPPVHTRLRKLISRDFTPRRIRELEPRIRELTNMLLDQVIKRGEFDVMRDLANPLPVMVIAEMLGVEPELYATFKKWSDHIVSGDNTMPGNPPPAEFHTSVNDLRAYFSDQIEKRRNNPGPDLVSALVTAHTESEALAADELMAFVILLLLAGNETTTNLIGNGTLVLGRNPDQMEMIRREPARLPRAIEEMLRYDGPVQSTARFTTSDIEVGGTFFPAGFPIFVILAAANRDPAQFRDPDRFDITRDPNEHFAFGEGIHFCIGAPLARLESLIAFSSMLERFPKLRLRDPNAKLEYKGSYFLRGLASLPMAID